MPQNPSFQISPLLAQPVSALEVSEMAHGCPETDVFGQDISLIVVLRAKMICEEFFWIDVVRWIYTKKLHGILTLFHGVDIAKVCLAQLLKSVQLKFAVGTTKLRRQDPYFSVDRRRAFVNSHRATTDDVAPHNRRQPASRAFYLAEQTPIVLKQIFQGGGPLFGPFGFLFGQQASKQFLGGSNPIQNFFLDGFPPVPQHFDRGSCVIIPQKVIDICSEVLQQNLDHLICTWKRRVLRFCRFLRLLPL